MSPNEEADKLRDRPRQKARNGFELNFSIGSGSMLDGERVVWIYRSGRYVIMQLLLSTASEVFSEWHEPTNNGPGTGKR
jgi:hypothetical protein